MTTTLLALTTLDGQSNRFLEKAAALAVTLGARLRLAYCSDDIAPFDAPLARLEQRTRHLARLFDVPVDMVHEDIRSLETLRTCLAQCTLVAVSHPLPGPDVRPSERELLDRLIRLRSVPVLVIRPETHGFYRKVLVPVSMGSDPAGGVRWAMALARHATIDLFHAADPASLPMGERIDAYRRMGNLTRGLDDDSPRKFVYTVGRGPVETAIVQEQRHNQQDLVVLGDPPQSLWSRLWRAPLAARLIGGLSSDVLFIPRTRASGVMHRAPPWEAMA